MTGKSSIPYGREPVDPRLQRDVMAPTVLIIESDEHSLEAMSRAFVSHGAEVSTARDGEAGYASAESTLPDLIVLSV